MVRTLHANITTKTISLINNNSLNNYAFLIKIRVRLTKVGITFNSQTHNTLYTDAALRGVVGLRCYAYEDVIRHAVTSLKI